MFEVFDPNSTAGGIYRILVAEPRSTVGHLAKNLSVDDSVVRRQLAELQHAGIVVPVDEDGEAWDARRPDLVAADTLRHLEGRRAQVHDAESRLTEIFRFARYRDTGGTEIEFIDNRSTTFARFRVMQHGVRSEVRAIDRPPYYWDEAEIGRQEQLQIDQMSTGIRYRTIYQESESDSPVRNASMMRTVAHGESARVLADPPVKLTIVDDHQALLALDPPAGHEDLLSVVILHRSALLNAVIAVFESLWRLAVPVNLTRPAPLSDREREILTLMASGATDDAIARRLGLSRRTVVRHVGRLLEHVGATTRFQAGAQASRRGWL